MAGAGQKRGKGRRGGGGDKEAEGANADGGSSAGWSRQGIVAFALGAVVPGLGHAFLGKRARAACFLVAIGALLALGLANQGGLYTPRTGEPLTYLATFANLGVGPVYYVLRAVGLGVGSPDHPAFEYGGTFILTAGLLNYLIMLDAYDIAAGKKR